jgi:hypothetical protein
MTSTPAATAQQPPMSRRLWWLFEPLHAVTYFVPQSRAALEAVGLRGFWRGYFAARSAPLGAVGPAPVIAMFYGFAPEMVERALPSVWSLADPQTVLVARRAGARAALEALGAEPDDAALAEAADLARTAATRADTGGRALAAANAGLPWPEHPLEVLWQAATVLREHRGDGHLAALLTSGLSGLDSIILRAGSDLSRALVQPARGWTDQEWDLGAQELTTRGLLDPQGRITDAGATLLADIEVVTDHLATQPWAVLGADGAARFAELVRPLAREVMAVLPPVTPIGLPDVSKW